MQGNVLSIPIVLLALAVPVRAEIVGVTVNTTVTASDLTAFPGAAVGSSAVVTFFAVGNAIDGYGVVNEALTVGSLTYAMNVGVAFTDGTTNDNISFTFGNLNNIPYRPIGMFLEDPTGTALVSSQLGDSLGTSTDWTGGVQIIQTQASTIVLDAAVTSVTFSAPMMSRWVDATGGDNTNGGSSPTDAFASISFAVLNSAPGATIHVLPGTYSSALGETYPVTLLGGTSLVGEEGPAVTTLVGTGSQRGVRINAAGSIVTDLRLTDFATAIVGGPLALLQNLEIADCNIGISQGFGGAGSTIEETRIESCNVGINGSTSVQMNRCLIRGCSFGMLLQTVPGATLSIEQCLLFLNDIGMDLFGTGGTVTVKDSLFAWNTTGLDGNNGSLIVERSTVANNMGAGITGASIIEGSIVWGNGTDLVGTPGITNSNTGDPTLAGLNGNLSADPLFQDPALLDFRLSFGSPCVDTAPSILEVDAFQRPRIIDGDLDSVSGRDMGAFELRTLALAGVPVLGTTVPLELNGPPGSHGLVFASSILPDPPLVTPLGTWYLPHTQAIPLARVHFDANGTATVGFAIPNQPDNVGTPLYLQGLVRSPAAPVAFATTDLVTLVVQP